MKRKVIYVITKSVFGGAQKYVYDLAVNMPKDQFEAVVVAGGQGQLIEKLNQAGVRTITLPALQNGRGIFEVLFSFINIRALFSLIKIFRQEKPDIIHLNSSKIGGVGSLAAWLSKRKGPRAKVVYTVHGWPFNEPRPWWQRRIIFFLSWLSTILTDKIILISTVDFRTALEFIPRRKCNLIFNGIDSINFLPRVEARLHLTKKVDSAIASDAILIGTIAELTKNKGLSILITALNLTNYRGSTSIIIGEGTERQTLQNQIATLHLQNKIFLIGLIPEAQQYIKAFDIFILPSFKEGLPYTIMEAMAAGVPVVATNVGGVPDLIHHEEEGILIPPGDSKALNTAVTRLIQNPILRTQLGKRGARKIVERFSLTQMVQQTTTLYELR
jgi:glycosyltransferase involved in cell wall biosynthesis